MKGRFLLADDDRSLSEALKAGLEYCGHKVACAPDGARALLLAHELTPDAILLDLAMPILDGMATLCALRKDPKTEAIPVIVITGNATNSTIARGHALGADLWLEKPFTFREVLRILERLLPQRGSGTLRRQGS